MTKYYEVIINGVRVYVGTPKLLNTNDCILHAEGKRLAIKAMKAFNTNEVTITIGVNAFTYRDEIYRETFKV